MLSFPCSFTCAKALKAKKQQQKVKNLTLKYFIINSVFQLTLQKRIKCKVSKNATNYVISLKKSLQKVYVPLREIETVILTRSVYNLQGILYYRITPHTEHENFSRI